MYLCRTGSSRASDMYLCRTGLKVSSGAKIEINIKPYGMYEWFDCHLLGCGRFTEYDRELLGFPPPQDDQNASSEENCLIWLQFHERNIPLNVWRPVLYTFSYTV